MDKEEAYRKEGMIFSYILEETKEELKEFVFFSDVCRKFDFTGGEAIRSLGLLEEAGLLRAKLTFVSGSRWERAYSVINADNFLTRQN